VTGEVVGVRDLQRRLKAIDKSIQPKIVAQAARAAMIPMMKEARANAPQGKKTHRTYKGRLVAPGFLKRNIKLRKMKLRSKEHIGYSLAARKEAWYGKLIETGFKGIPGKSWLGRADRTHGNQVSANFRRNILARIERAKR